MSTSTKTRQQIRIQPKLDVQPPSMFNVIYVNDNTTTMEFVVETLCTIFDHSEETAVALTMKIHEDGSAVVGTYPYEIAEQKGVEVTLLARNNGFPLGVKLEADQ
jgi:ATP-dependent Clp protease adaptor protein ClpS